MVGTTCIYVHVTEEERKAWLAAADGRMLADWARDHLNDLVSPQAEVPRSAPGLAAIARDLLAAAARCRSKGLLLTSERLTKRAVELKELAAQSASAMTKT